MKEEKLNPRSSISGNMNPHTCQKTHQPKRMYSMEGNMGPHTLSVKWLQITPIQKQRGSSECSSFNSNQCETVESLCLSKRRAVPSTPTHVKQLKVSTFQRLEKGLNTGDAVVNPRKQEALVDLNMDVHYMSRLCTFSLLKALISPSSVGENTKSMCKHPCINSEAMCNFLTQKPMTLTSMQQCIIV